MPGNSNFLEICRSNSLKDVLRAIKNGAGVNERDGNGNTPLIFAASGRPSVKVIGALIDNGAGVNARNNDGLTPLMFAAANTTYPAVITLLLNAGAEVDAALDSGRTALMFAAAANPDPEIIGMLCGAGARVNRRAEDDGTTALMLAAERNPNADVVKELIKHGANVNATDDSGRTALIGAALRNSKLIGEPDPNPEIIDALLDGGADVNAVWDGDRAIDIAKDSPYLQGTDTLLRLKALSTRGKQNVTDDPLIDRFLDSLSITPASVTIYRKRLRYFFAWMHAHGIMEPKREHLLIWRDELMSSARKPATVAGYLNLVRHFYKWAHGEGLREDISKDLKAPKVGREFHDDALTQEQVQKMFDSMDRGNVTGLRDYALLSLILACSLSYAEVARAKVGDIATENGEAFIDVAGARVSVPPSVMDALREYWQAVGEVGPESPLFHGGRTHKRKPMSVKAIGAVAKAAVRKIGADKRLFTPNSLRHTAVRLALRSGKRIEEVQKFARHRYIGTTYRYGKISPMRRVTCGETVAAAIF